MLKRNQSCLLQRINRNNKCSVLFRLLKCGEHAWMIGARVLPDNDDDLGIIKIIERYRPFTYAQCFGECHTAGFMAHVRAVRKIIGAVHPHEELVKKGSLVARSA